jgi:8-amino-7-oxononanoate synthase
MSLLDDLQGALADLDAESLRRVRRSNEIPCGARMRVAGREMLSFCSNDYLGLAADPTVAKALIESVVKYGVGSGASHLVSGHYDVHDRLEERLAGFLGCERALYFTTGYMANVGVVPAMVGRGDEVFADRLIHASLVDGALLSRASLTRYPHNDLIALEVALKASTARRKLIMTDGVFSMDGDVAPLAQLLELAERFDTWLLVDDAHGFGVLGPQGRGSLAEAGLDSWRIILIGTLSKAAGVSGAFAAGQTEVIEWLMQKARTGIFTTASPPVLAAALLASIDLIEQDDFRRERLNTLIEVLRGSLKLERWQLLPSRTAIQPVQIGDNAEALRVAASLRDAGVLVPAIRPPTVPRGTARLRVSLSARHEVEDVLRLADLLNALEAF